MPSKTSRRLVIDASVAFASGNEKAIHPTSKHCRDFLLATLKICHQVVMTAAIRDEWNKHQSDFARRWRVSMVARKKLYIADLAPNEVLREKVGRAAVIERHRKAMLKDMHLIEAAMAADQIVISLDEIVRALFIDSARNVSELRMVIWANPAKTEERCITWLEGGARAEKKRRLGFIE